MPDMINTSHERPCRDGQRQTIRADPPDSGMPLCVRCGRVTPRASHDDHDQSTPGLDWSDRAHWGGGQTCPCRLCGRPALLVDDNRLPAHKICVDSLEPPRARSAA